MSNPTSTSPTASQADVPTLIADLCLKLASGSGKTQLQAVQDLSAAGESGLTALQAFLLEQRDHLLDNSQSQADASSSPNLAAGKAYQFLRQSDSAQIADWLQAHFPQGIVPLRSEMGVDYTVLQQLLAKQEFLEADKETLQKLCELAGANAIQRKWVYFTEAKSFPVTDLQTINLLWLLHSEGQFGFSVQREIWLSLGKSWEKLWEKIGWKAGNNWTRYPQEFAWDLTAPRGHLPLSNQLRGVRMIEALLQHPAWEK